MTETLRWSVLWRAGWIVLIFDVSLTGLLVFAQGDLLLSVPSIVVSVLGAVMVRLLALKPKLVLTDSQLIVVNPFNTRTIDLANVAQFRVAQFVKQHWWEWQLGRCLYIKQKGSAKAVRVYAIQALEADSRRCAWADRVAERLTHELIGPRN